MSSSDESSSSSSSSGGSSSSSEDEAEHVSKCIILCVDALYEHPELRGVINKRRQLSCCLFTTANAFR